MNIADTILQSSKVATFIKTEFENYTRPPRIELLKQSHFLYTKNFNAAPRKGFKYSIGDHPIKDMFAYVLDSQYALYINIGYEKKMLDSLVKSLGIPNNVWEEDLISGDFDFLHWGRDGDFQILFTSSRNEENDVTLIITNLPFDSLINKEPIVPD